MTIDLYNRLLIGNNSLIAHCTHISTLSRHFMDILASSLKTEQIEQENATSTEDDDIKCSQQGDSDAYRRLIERHQSHVSKLLWRFSRDKLTHEELVQETFVQAYISLNNYKATAPFEHWLTRIAIRVGYRYWKQAKQHTHFSLRDDDWEQIADDSQQKMSPEIAGQLVHRLLAQLSPRDRLVLTLRYLEQYSVEETANRTGWSVSLVKVQTYRAKQKLKKLLKNSDLELEIES